MFEAAGVGKISLEEGIDAANMAIEIVAKNPNLIKSEGSLLGATEYVIDVEKLAKKYARLVMIF